MANYFYSQNNNGIVTIDDENMQFGCYNTQKLSKYFRGNGRSGEQYGYTLNMDNYIYCIPIPSDDTLIGFNFNIKSDYPLMLTCIYSSGYCNVFCHTNGVTKQYNSEQEYLNNSDYNHSGDCNILNQLAHNVDVKFYKQVGSICTSPSVHGYGLEIMNEKGNVIYTTDKKIMAARQVVTWTYPDKCFNSYRWREADDGINDYNQYLVQLKKIVSQTTPDIATVDYFGKDVIFQPCGLHIVDCGYETLTIFHGLCWHGGIANRIQTHAFSVRTVDQAHVSGLNSVQFCSTLPSTIAFIQ